MLLIHMFLHLITQYLLRTVQTFYENQVLLNTFGKITPFPTFRILWESRACISYTSSATVITLADTSLATSSCQTPLCRTPPTINPFAVHLLYTVPIGTLSHFTPAKILRGTSRLSRDKTGLLLVKWLSQGHTSPEFNPTLLWLK